MYPHFLFGLVVGVFIGICLGGFAAVHAYSQGYASGEGRRTYWKAELKARSLAGKRVRSRPVVSAGLFAAPATTAPEEAVQTPTTPLTQEGVAPEATHLSEALEALARGNTVGLSLDTSVTSNPTLDAVSAPTSLEAVADVLTGNGLPLVFPIPALTAATTEVALEPVLAGAKTKAKPKRPRKARSK